MKNNILILSSFLLFSCSDFYQPAVVSARKEATQIGLEIMKNGGNGCISVTANVLPKLCSDFQNLCIEGNYDEALKIHKKLEPMHNALFIETSPSPVKYVLSKMGRIEDELRLPLVSIRQETKEILDKVISDLDLI